MEGTVRRVQKGTVRRVLKGTVRRVLWRTFFDNGVLRALCGLCCESKNASGKGIESQGTILASPTPPHNEYFFPKNCSFSILSLSMPSGPITSQSSLQVWAWYKVGKTYEQVSLSESEPRVEDNPSKSRRKIILGRRSVVLNKLLQVWLMQFPNSMFKYINPICLPKSLSQ